ncbi:cohesin domain-containing protein [Chloroflexota bacterium]
MRRKPLIAGIVIIVIAAIAVGGVLVIRGGGDDDEKAAVEVPINLEGASNVGSISIELVYDSDMLEATEVKAGKMATNAMIESNIGIPGRVIIGIIDSSGINGDGAIATVSFKLLGDGGSSSLILQNVETHDATTLIDVVNQTSDGSVAKRGTSIIAPAVNFVD